MAFKLTKAEDKRRDELATRLEASAGDLASAITKFNEALDAARTELEAARDAYNEVVGDARSFCEDIASAAEDAISDKSDKWQEGDRGQAAAAWRDEWEGITLDDVELDLPEDVTLDTPEHNTALLELPGEMES